MSEDIRGRTMPCASEPRRRNADAAVGARVARRWRTRLAWLATLLTLTGSLALAGCGGSGGSEPADSAAASEPGESVNTAFQNEGDPIKGATLTYATSFETKTYTPWLITSNGDLFAQMQIYDTLVAAGPDASKLLPALAQSWTISDDKLTYTFALRPGVKFSDGQPLTARDIKFNLDTQRDPKTAPLQSQFLASIRSVSIPDDSHVRVQLAQVTPAFLNYLTLIMVVPQELVEKLGAEEFGRDPVGSGPFMVSKFAPGSDTLELKANPHYWGKGKPYLDGVTYRYIADDNSRLLAVQSGSADIADTIPYSLVERVEGSQGVSLFKQSAFASAWVFVNGYKPPLDKTEVRQALAYATPFENIADVVFHGLVPTAATASMPTKYLDKPLKPYPYDPAKARELLARAGEPDLRLTFTTIAGDAVGKQIATILQSSYAEAGIKLVIEPKDYATAITALTSQDFELFMARTNDQTSDIPLDDEFDLALAAKPAPKQFPFHGWDNAKARRLVAAATSTFDEEKRRKLFAQFQQILREEQPIISLGYPPNLYAVRSNVHGFVAAGTSWPLLSSTWLTD